MKHLALILLLSLGSFSAHAQNDGPGLWIPITSKADVMPEEEKTKNLCYRMARFGDLVEMREEAPAWQKSTDRVFVWRITRLSTGLKCRELVQGRYNLQFGSADRLGCECQGNIEIHK